MSLILTLSLDERSHRFFTDLRTLHFPAWCNYLEAHITLFHQLPENDPSVRLHVSSFAARSAFTLQVTGIHNTGNGVAYALQSAELSDMHVSMQQVFSAFLISQDRQKLRPHITVQNKVTAFKALQTTQLLQRDFTPFTVQATGLALHAYRGGPWEAMEAFPFRS